MYDLSFALIIDCFKVYTNEEVKALTKGEVLDRSSLWNKGISTSWEQNLWDGEGKVKTSRHGRNYQNKGRCRNSALLRSFIARNLE